MPTGVLAGDSPARPGMNQPVEASSVWLCAGPHGRPSSRGAQTRTLSPLPESALFTPTIDWPQSASTSHATYGGAVLSPGWDLPDVLGLLAVKESLATKFRDILYRRLIFLFPFLSIPHPDAQPSPLCRRNGGARPGARRPGPRPCDRWARAATRGLITRGLITADG